jgi:hypothetical protein
MSFSSVTVNLVSWIASPFSAGAAAFAAGRAEGLGLGAVWAGSRAVAVRPRPSVRAVKYGRRWSTVRVFTVVGLQVRRCRWRRERILVGRTLSVEPQAAGGEIVVGFKGGSRLILRRHSA